MGSADGSQARPAVPYATALCLDLSRDSSLVACGGDILRVHEIKSGRQLYRLSAPPLTRAVAFSPAADDLLASGGDDGAVRLWRVGNPEPVRVLGEPAATGLDLSGAVMDLAFSPDGKLLAVCSGAFGKGKVTLWEVETGRAVHSLGHPAEGISCLAFSHDGERLAFVKSPGGLLSGNQSNKEPATVEVYDVSEWELVRRIPFWPGVATTIAFAPDSGKLLIAGGESISLPTPQPIPISTSVALDVFERGYVWTADIDSKCPALPLITGREGIFQSLSFVPAGELFASCTRGLGHSKGRVQLWSTLTKQTLWSVQTEGIGAEAVAVSPDGRYVGASLWGGELQLFDARNGERLRSIHLRK